MTDCATSGEKFDKMKAEIAAAAGEAAAKMIHAAVAFDVQESPSGGFRAGLGKVHRLTRSMKGICSGVADSGQPDLL